MMQIRKRREDRSFSPTKGQWVLFALLDLVVTFQLTAQFLFMRPEQRAVTLWQAGAFLACAVAVGGLLYGAARLLARLDARGVFRARSRAGRESRLARWLLAGAVFLAVTAAGRCWLPDFVAVSYREASVTLRVAEPGGEVGLLSTMYVNGAPAPLAVRGTTGDWTAGPDGSWRAAAPGSAITLDIPAAEDVDLRLIPGAAGGTAEITDGEHITRRELYTADPSDAPEVYHVRSGIVSHASSLGLWALAVLAGLAYAGAAWELYTATVGETSPGRYRRAVFFALCGIWLVYLAAGNPGAMSTDSLSQLSQAMGVNPVTDAHPALLTFFYRLVWRLTGRVWPITVCQIAAFAAVVSAFAGYLARSGFSRRWLTGFSVLFGVHVVNGVYAAVLWKDVPYTVCLLWLTLLLLRIGTEKKAFFTPGNIVQTGLCLALTLLLRHNGLIVLLAAAAALAIQSALWRTARPLLSAALAAALVLGVRGPAFRALGVEAKAIYDSAEFLHGMAYAQLATGEEDPFLTELAPREVWDALYYPYSANDITMSPLSLENGIPEKAAALGRERVLEAYLAAFRRHPALLLKDRLYGCNLLWNPVPSGYNYRVCGDRYEYVVESNLLGFYCRESFLTAGVGALYGLTADNLLLDAVIWRPGWCVALMLLLVWLGWVLKKGAAALAALPMAANGLSLAMAMAWQDYRYVYFAFVCAVFLLLSFFALPSIKREETISL